MRPNRPFCAHKVLAVQFATLLAIIGAAIGAVTRLLP
jgi:hypothetical protein